MTIVYSLADTDVADDQKTITISESKSVTSEEKVTVAQLKEQHAQKLEQIEALKVGADELVDQLTEINANVKIDLTVKDIPVKLVK